MAGATMNIKTKKIAYWLTTTLFALDMALAGVLYLLHAPFLMKAFAHLGYPDYFPNILGVAKILGACALLAPVPSRLKEWAYAGFGITLISGFVSHLVLGDGLTGTDGFGALAPALVFAVLTASYLTRPAAQRSSRAGMDSRVQGHGSEGAIDSSYVVHASGG
jgi:peptidoglycan/LPS O-acetylase OafA/YrhL